MNCQWCSCDSHCDCGECNCRCHTSELAHPECDEHKPPPTGAEED